MHEHEHFIHAVIIIRTNLHALNRARKKEKIVKRTRDIWKSCQFLHLYTLFDLNLFFSLNFFNADCH